MPHLKIAVSDTVFCGVTAYAADENKSAAMVFGELVEEALRARSFGATRRPPANPMTAEMVVAAGIERMWPGDFEEHLKSLGWMCWIEERREAANAA